MNALMTSIGWTLIDFVWQGAVIGTAAAILLAVMRRASAGSRYLVACGALLACFAWPTLTLAGRLASADAMPLAVMALGQAATASAGPDGIRQVLHEHLDTIVWAWAACALVLGVRMSFGLLWIGRFTTGHGHTDASLQARLQQLADRFGVTREVRIRVVDHLASPITAGWWRPVVLVPATLVTGMPPDLLDALLAHEMAHIKRMDYVVNLCQNVIETLLFYHPAVWWISKQVRDEREKVADDAAASHLGEPRRLALALSELEKLQFSPHHLAQAANGGDLMVRIKRLIKPDTQASSWKAALPVLALVLATCALQFPQPAYADAKAAPGFQQAVLNFKSCAKPKYPAESLAQKHTGTVNLEFDVNDAGKIVSSRVSNSSGHPALDEAARTALQKCTMKPATQEGKPVSSKAKVQYVWTLA